MYPTVPWSPTPFRSPKPRVSVMEEERVNGTTFSTGPGHREGVGPHTDLKQVFREHFPNRRTQRTHQKKKRLVRMVSRGNKRKKQEKVSLYRSVSVSIKRLARERFDSFK